MEKDLSFVCSERRTFVPQEDGSISIKKFLLSTVICLGDFEWVMVKGCGGDYGAESWLGNPGFG